MAASGPAILGAILLWSVLIVTGLWFFAVFYWGWSSAKPSDGITLYGIPGENL